MPLDKEESLQDSQSTADDISDPPPAYSPRPNSVASSEVSLRTIEPDAAPEFINKSQQVEGCYNSNGVEFSVGLGRGFRTSAFIQAFMRPKTQPRLVSVGLNTQTVKTDANSSGQSASGCKQLARDSHRVRIVAHASCESAVKGQGIDFFAIGHDLINPLASACTQLPRPRMSSQLIKGWKALTKGQQVYSLMRLSKSPSGTRRAYSISEPINYFRQHVLGLRSISPTSGGRLVFDHEIPHNYFCSELLLARPSDWPSIHGTNFLVVTLLGSAMADGNVEISGFVLENDTSPYSPPESLANFVVSDPPVIYFMLHEDNLATTGRLTRAIEGVVGDYGFRVLLSECSWSMRGSAKHDNVLLADSIPHHWLLPQVAVIVHDGNSETTALALQYGKPSVVIPHSKDQLSRGIAMSKLGAAAAPITNDLLTPEALAQGLAFCLRPDIQASTRSVHQQIKEEKGLESAVEAFYRGVRPSMQSCSISGQDLAIYHVWNRPSLRISAEAAAILIEERLIKQTDVVFIQAEKSNPDAIESTAMRQWEGFTSAAKSIATASDLVSMLPGLQRKPSQERSPVEDTTDWTNAKRNVAKDVGIGTARFFGHIALLPFTSTALVVNTVAYGVKSVKGDRESRREVTRPDTAMTYDSGASPEYRPSHVTRGLKMQETGVINPATGQRVQWNGHSRSPCMSQSAAEGNPGLDELPLPSQPLYTGHLPPTP
ncbi:glycosyltransferase [Aspergillus thermomutatus]|uniref:Erythromycin biosynthesis protein CIII-like C-terminal domain-containing protein n=1 Tax=Aspergillus thermomutatus TaxID=41047 RepID=A0A397HWK2_ASPTH|nr:uncharacterized protein CDV56_109572 [Aspergillus thermomutatus]RHZ67187.1 hypothetical protein CDV56_109572 [Aspergillus thermomutatus]